MFSMKPQSPLPKKRKMSSSANHVLLFQNPGLASGDTILHSAIRKATSLAELETELKEYTEEQIATMALITNDEGMLPVDLVAVKSRIDFTTGQQLREQLYAIMKKHTTTRLNQRVVVTMPAPASPRLTYNLAVARKIALDARKIIHDSSTHPQMNDYSVEQQNKVADDLREMRNAKRIPQPLLDEAAETAARVKQCKIGNCHEYSYLALDMLRKREPGLSGECFRILHGDHVILVIDRANNSDSANSSTWGNSAVVCDAWSGEVYPAADIPWKLRNFQNYTLNKLTLNIVASYNPWFHKLQPLYSIHSTAPHPEPEDRPSKRVRRS